MKLNTVLFVIVTVTYCEGMYIERFLQGDYNADGVFWNGLTHGHQAGFYLHPNYGYLPYNIYIPNNRQQVSESPEKVVVVVGDLGHCNSGYGRPENKNQQSAGNDGRQGPVNINNQGNSGEFSNENNPNMQQNNQYVSPNIQNEYPNNQNKITSNQNGNNPDNQDLQQNEKYVSANTHIDSPNNQYKIASKNASRPDNENHSPTNQANNLNNHYGNYNEQSKIPNSNTYGGNQFNSANQFGDMNNQYGNSNSWKAQ